jgi:hypothetical protein
MGKISQKVLDENIRKVHSIMGVDGFSKSHHPDAKGSKGPADEFGCLRPGRPWPSPCRKRRRHEKRSAMVLKNMFLTYSIQKWALL